MNKILRTLGLSAAIVGSVGLGTTPASAVGAGNFIGEASIVCFGCNVSTGTADLCVNGVFVAEDVPPTSVPPAVTQVECEYDGDNTVWNVEATYTVIEIPSQCPVTGSATGSTTGAVNVTFNWTRVGANAVITTTGDIDGGGTASFAVTDPVGNPCGGPVTAAVAGMIVGTA